MIQCDGQISIFDLVEQPAQTNLDNVGIVELDISRNFKGRRKRNLLRGARSCCIKIGIRRKNSVMVK